MERIGKVLRAIMVYSGLDLQMTGGLPDRIGWLGWLFTGLDNGLSRDWLGVIQRIWTIGLFQVDWDGFRQVLAFLMM